MPSTNSAKKRWFFFITGSIIIILMGLVIRVSYHNTAKYYLKSTAGAVEIWQGTFSPGKKSGS